MIKNLLVAALFLVALVADAQTFHHCGTHSVNDAVLEQHPELLQERQALEEFSTDFETPESQRSVNKVIPIVFHIVHNYGPENISREQVEDALRIINEDFQLQNEDQSEVVSSFTSIVANSEVEFRLARKDPNGNCTDGITRTVSTLTFAGNDNVKDLISWPRNRYLNIWVVDNVILEDGTQVGGYAYRPGNSPGATYDGIIVTHRQLGSIGTSNGGNFAARTLTHEIGHWFNLNHTWGPSNTPGLSSNCSSDDSVNDTPNTVGVANQSCNLTQVTCGTLDNVQNYMDYANCAIMFTNGQKTRMQAALNSTAGQRNNLWTSANLTATGVNGNFTPCAPIADFISSTTSTCVSNSVSFTDLSFNAEVDASWTWNWTFTGANPGTSTQQNPSVQYTTPGVYPVTLTVSNASGTNSKTKSGFINVRPADASINSPYVEGFESTGFPNINPESFNNWSIVGQQSAFNRTTNASATGSASVQYINGAVSEGSITELVSPSIDCSNIASPATVTFKVAYARRNVNTNDRLQMFISTNCGRTWTPRYTKTGSTLATTTGFVSSTFIPTASQWRTETVNVTPLIGNGSALIKFVVTDSSGGNIYLDDINIVNAPVGIEDVVFDEQLTQVFPNPGSDDAQIAYTLNVASEVQIAIYDITGKQLGFVSRGLQPAGDHSAFVHELLRGQTPKPGVYLIRLESQGVQKTLRWICH